MGCTTGFSWVEVRGVAVSYNIQDGHTAKDSPIHIVNRTEIEQACPCDKLYYIQSTDNMKAAGKAAILRQPKWVHKGVCI